MKTNWKLQSGLWEERFNNACQANAQMEKIIKNIDPIIDIVREQMESSGHNDALSPTHCFHCQMVKALKIWASIRGTTLKFP